MTETIAVVVSRNRNSSTDQQTLENNLLRELANRPGIALTVVPHLYDLRAEGPSMELLRSIRGDMIVLGWLYPRAVYWVLAANGVQGRLGPTSSLAQGDLDESDRQPGDNSPSRTICCLDLRGRTIGPSRI